MCIGGALRSTATASSADVAFHAAVAVVNPLSTMAASVAKRRQGALAGRMPPVRQRMSVGRDSSNLALRKL